MTSKLQIKLPRAPDDGALVFVALGAYVVSFFMPPIPVGLMGFISALGALYHCVTKPTNISAGEWLFGLSWLANPSVWAAMVLLAIGRRRRAALAAFIALLLAACLVSLGLHLPPYYVWIGSMVVVVFASLRVPRSVKHIEDDLQIEPIAGSLARSRWLLGLALGAPVLLGAVLFALSLREAYSLKPALDAWDNPDMNENVHIGEDARSIILRGARAAHARGENPAGLPASAKCSPSTRPIRVLPIELARWTRMTGWTLREP